MKALSLLQPWASLVVHGHKRIETRSWETRYRGPLAIHASASFAGWQAELCAKEPFAAALAQCGLTARSLPRGAVVGMCSLAHVAQVSANTPVLNFSPRELLFGDYSVGRWMWFLARAVKCAPVKARGALGLWEWDETKTSRMDA